MDNNMGIGLESRETGYLISGTESGGKKLVPVSLGGVSTRFLKLQDPRVRAVLAN